MYRGFIRLLNRRLLVLFLISYLPLESRFPYLSISLD